MLLKRPNGQYVSSDVRRTSQLPHTTRERSTVAEHSVVGSEHRPRSVRRLSDDFFTTSERGKSLNTWLARRASVGR